jgi:hypothetical protein
MQLEVIKPTVQVAGVTRNTSMVIVSDVHLKEGVPDSESWCPLAIALREELQARPMFDEVEVTADWVHVSLRHGSWHAPVTHELYEFIEQFDATVDDEGEQDPEKLEALVAKASAGLLRFPLTWYEGDPPSYDEDGFGCEGGAASE